MGDNEIRLAKAYLELRQKLLAAQTSGDSFREAIIAAKMEGVAIGYETYAAKHWLTIENLLEKYEEFNC